MRAAFGILGLLVVIAIVGVLVKKQMAPATAPAPAVVASPDGPAAPAGTPKQQVEQVRQAVDAAMQQAPRQMPEEGR